MFDINEFIMKTLKGMIGKYPDFQVREYSLNWHEKGKLTEDDLATVDSLIEAQYILPEAPVDVEVTTEEAVEETEIENTNFNTDVTTDETDTI